MSNRSMGGIGMLLALVIGACSGSAQAIPGGEAITAVPVSEGSYPQGHIRDAWQIGYCMSAENDAAEKHEGEGQYGTGSYPELLAERPCILDMAFGYGDLLEKHHLVGEKDHEKVWKILGDKEEKFRDDVIRFADGYAENFVNR